MKKFCNFLSRSLLLAGLFALTTGCTCGFDCSSDDDDEIVAEGPVALTLRFSDALPEELKEVVLNVEGLSFVHSESGETRITEYTIEELGLTGADSFQIDLLQFGGLQNLVVLTDHELESGFYSSLNITISSNDENLSYVLTSEDEQHAIVVENGALTLRDFQLDAGAQDFVVEFGLPRALSLDEDTNIYRLSEEGVRLQDTATDVSIEGTIDSELFDNIEFEIEDTCNDKLLPPAEGNRVYLYAGRSLNSADLADVFTDESVDPIPASAIAPFAVATIAANPNSDNLLYAFGFLPAGDYTLAFTCNAEEDDAINYDDISIPLPADQVYEFTLDPGDDITCNIDTNDSCNEP